MLASSAFQKFYAVRKGYSMHVQMQRVERDTSHVHTRLLLVLYLILFLHDLIYDGEKS
jgi:hypothetical protein